MNPNRQTIFFDFDGVIADSNGIKEDGFKHIVSRFPDELTQKFVEYHRTNGGLSRFEKIRFFYEKILGQSISEEEIQAQSQLFSSYVKQRLLDPHILIHDTINFIEKYSQRFPLHVMSASEEQELQTICQFHHIDKFFRTIRGSPKKKHILIQETLHQFGYNPKKTILIGDSLNDYEAAQQNGIIFWGYNNPRLQSLGFYISSFSNLTL